MFDPTPSNAPDAPARYEAGGGIATITMNRPETLNAMNAPLQTAVRAGLIAANSDDTVRVVILTGAGRGFSSGGDLRSVNPLGKGPAEAKISVLRSFMETSQMLREMPKITIAAINGACAGAGMSWACAADLRYAAESAKFLTAFGTAGLSGDFGGTWTLPRIVGPAKARELYLLGDIIDAQEALRLNLVSGVFPRRGLPGTRAGDRAAAARSRAHRAAQHQAESQRWGPRVVLGVARPGGRAARAQRRERGPDGGRLRLLRASHAPLPQSLTRH